MYKHDFTDNCGFYCIGNKGLFHFKTAVLINYLLCGRIELSLLSALSSLAVGPLNLLHN